MKEIQITCPQCGVEDGYLEREDDDFTGGMFWVQQPWECSRCEYPRVTWTKWGRTYQNNTSVTINFESVGGKER